MWARVNHIGVDILSMLVRVRGVHHNILTGLHSQVSIAEIGATTVVTTPAVVTQPPSNPTIVVTPQTTPPPLPSQARVPPQMVNVGAGYTQVGLSAAPPYPPPGYNSANYGPGTYGAAYSTVNNVPAQQVSTVTVVHNEQYLRRPYYRYRRRPRSADPRFRDVY